MLSSGKFPNIIKDLINSIFNTDFLKVLNELQEKQIYRKVERDFFSSFPCQH